MTETTLRRVQNNRKLNVIASFLLLFIPIWAAINGDWKTCIGGISMAAFLLCYTLFQARRMIRLIDAETIREVMES